MKLLVGACRDGTCPAVYLSDQGSLVVQGYEVESTEELPEGERRVEIPASLLVEAVRAYERSV
jgi:hypothetical protein